jgi:hypothetical protein
MYACVRTDVNRGMHARRLWFMPCRVPLPVWALALMLLPASLLLITVFTLPFVLRRWHVVCYTVAVFLLGVSLYAALQLLRRSGAVRFEHSDSLSQDRWRPLTLSVALAAFPSFLVTVGVLSGLPKLHALLVLCCTAAAVLLFTTMFLVVVKRGLKQEVDGRYGSHGAGPGSGVGWAIGGVMSRTVSSAAANLESIPESDAAMQAPLMRAFLQDSLVHLEDEKALLVRSESNSTDHGVAPIEELTTGDVADTPSPLG